jgi:hypothetical protein
VATLPRLAFRAWADKNDVSRSEAVRRLLEAGLKAKGKRGEVITGAQIRQARRLLNWRISELATRARVPASLIERAERSADYSGPRSGPQARLESAGVEFTSGDAPGVKLRRP